MTAKECPHGIRMALVAASAATAEAVTFPIDFGKTRMQLHAGRQTFSGALASAVRKEGIGGVYAGIQPAIVRHLVYSSLRISLYEDLRKRLTRHFSNSASSALAGLLGGGIAQAVASPADRLKVMLVHEGGRDGMVSLLQRILREEGVKGLYRGVVVNVQRAALVNLGELSTYDQAKKLILKRSGLDDGQQRKLRNMCCRGLTDVLRISRSYSECILQWICGVNLCHPCRRSQKPRHGRAGSWSRSVCSENRWRRRSLGLMERVLPKLGTPWAMATCVLDHLRTHTSSHGLRRVLKPWTVER
ncbi:unnamed protein product [Durusdinium trenchii]|uniref:Uncharacterized protein n=1 Tax=Durusdinium trenchii TaxID=1381693 RepID=A0ABP0IMB3_9DINO